MPAAEEFVYFSLDGDRFEAKGMPLEALAELVAFRQTVYEIARRLFVQNIPHRQRVSPHFETHLDLRLRRVKRGSAKPVIMLHAHEDGTLDVGMNGYREWFLSARDMITDTIESVGRGQGLPPGFPPTALPMIQRMGKSLVPGDRLTLGDPADASHRSVLDVRVSAVLQAIDETLDQLVAIDDSEPAWVSAAAVGLIVEFDTEARTFELRVNDDLRIPATLGDSVDVATFLGLVSAEGKTGPHVVVVGPAQVDERGAVVTFGRVTEMEELAMRHQALSRRLDGIRRLEAGWAGPESHAIAADPLSAVEGMLAIFDRAGPRVTLAPVADGAVRAEWSLDDVDYLIEFEADGSVYLCVIRLDRGAGEDDDLELATYDRSVLSTFYRTGLLPRSGGSS